MSSGLQRLQQWGLVEYLAFEDDWWGWEWYKLSWLSGMVGHYAFIS